LQSKFRRSGRLFLQQELWEADHRRRHRRRRRRRRRRLRTVCVVLNANGMKNRV